MSDRPLLTSVQLVPLLVERNTPLLEIPSYESSVPAKRSVPPTPFGTTASVRIWVFVKRSLTGVQLVPSSVERNTPPSWVPAKRFVPLRARAVTLLSVKPVLTDLQFVPLSVERNILAGWPLIPDCGPCKTAWCRLWREHDPGARQRGTDQGPTRTVVCGMKDITIIEESETSSHEDVVAAHGNRTNGTARQNGVDYRPACSLLVER